MNISRRERHMLAFTLYFILTYLFVYFIYNPLNNDLKKKLAEVEKLNQEIIEAELISESNYEDLLAEIDRETKAVLLRLPNNRDLPAIISFISLKSLESRIFIESLDYRKDLNQEEELINNVHALNFDINLKGNNYGLLNFLLKIEEAEQIYVLKSISIEAQHKKEIPTTTGVIANQEIENKIFTSLPLIETEENHQDIYSSDKVEQLNDISEIPKKASERIEQGEFLLKLKLQTFYISEEGSQGDKDSTDGE